MEMVLENEELGLVIADNPEEAFWIRIRDQATKVANEIIPEQIKRLEEEKKLNLWISENASKNIKTA